MEGERKGRGRVNCQFCANRSKFGKSVLVHWDNFCDFNNYRSKKYPDARYPSFRRAGYPVHSVVEPLGAELFRLEPEPDPIRQLIKN